MTIKHLTLEDYRNFATIATAILALIVYITNTVWQRRQRKIDNAMRFMAVLQRLTQCKFIEMHRRSMEIGTFSRESWNEERENEFSSFLGELEDFALLLRMGAVSRTLSIYMFGWFAQKIQPILTPEERGNVYWELAVQCLDELKNDADDFYKKTKAERDKYHRMKHFGH